ncbi:transcriptional regulator [Rhizobium rhizosphaerae]|uniref:Transcriptional regulator n=1 Tax=Xaviernesmea rhizosphaerae TaxID=1672749 RepID=A0A1Q9AFA4_9HYPH|nr:transcriptional regulator [Xaviernesmea rhizosphaerae]
MLFRSPSPRTVRWRSLDGEGLEHLDLLPKSDGSLLVRGVIIGGRGGEAYGVRYAIACDTRWHVRHFDIETTNGCSLSLSSDGEGRWFSDDGTPRPALDGCVDIDLAGTPFTNTLPIRRLALRPEDGPRQLTMLYIPFDRFEPVIDRQIYTCLVPGALYRYQAADRSFSADLPVDADGLVTDYPTLFQRV